MNATDYDFLCEFLMETSGLALGPNKQYLVNSRLKPLAQSWELDSVEQLVDELRKSDNRRLRTAVTEAMTTNETSFFRDKQPFDDFKSVLLPELIEARRHTRKIRIWCAACSTGQEPYSLRMLIHDEFPELQSWSVEIVATDIDTTALTRAREGIYSQFEVQRGLAIQSLIKHFSQVNGDWQVNDQLRNRITWKQINLLESFANLGPFDIVFCRNVLIYFDQPTKREMLERIHRVICRDGYLILGAAETVLGICDRFQRFKECKSAVYCSSADVCVS